MVLNSNSSYSLLRDLIISNLQINSSINLTTLLRNSLKIFSLSLSNESFLSNIFINNTNKSNNLLFFNNNNYNYK